MTFISCEEKENIPVLINGVQVIEFDGRVLFDADSIKGVIFHSEYKFTLDYEFTHEERQEEFSPLDFLPFSFKEEWNPTIKNIINFERQLFEHWTKSHPDKIKHSLSMFYVNLENLSALNGRQYVGFINDKNEQHIWAILFRTNTISEDWEKQIIGPTGIDPVLIQILYNVERDSIAILDGY